MPRVKPAILFNMNELLCFLLALALLQNFALAHSIPNYFTKAPVTRSQLDVEQVRRELGCRVSKTSTIFGPDDDSYVNATARWNPIAAPRIQVVIAPGEESDVSVIVCYTPFGHRLPLSRGYC